MNDRDALTDQGNPGEVLKVELQGELEQAKKELKEIGLMLEQSQIEVNKLAQRNASITAHLQQMQPQFDTLPRSDIRMAYEGALDAQQRLFVMRSQVEKLQSDQLRIKRLMELAEKTIKVIDGGAGSEPQNINLARAGQSVETMVQAQEAERLRLSRQMHDGPAQALSNFILQTEIATRLFDLDPARAKDELSNLKLAATTTFQKVRDFIFELRPMMLDDLGLIPTIKRYVDAHKDQTNMEIRLTVTGSERRLESYQEVMIFRAIQELMNNATRHSQANQVRVNVDMGESNIKVVVDDDGKGFNVETLANRSSVGLKVIRDRVEMSGGFMDIESALGQGTRVTFQIPAARIRTADIA